MFQDRLGAGIVKQIPPGSALTTPPWHPTPPPGYASRTPNLSAKGSPDMMTIAALLIILWLLGFLTSYTLGGLIHILLVIAIIVILVRVIQGRKPV